jgi:uncharacterized protein YabE (DUF348 family)
MKKISAKKRSHISVFQPPEKEHFFSRHPFIIPVTSFVAIFFVGLALFVSLGGQTVGAADRRIVEVFYDGKNQIVPTRAKSVKELLTKLEITVGPKDTVEPALDTPIVEDNFRINVYRARAVEVIDGATKLVIQSSAKSARIVAKEAGVTLNKEDAATFIRPDDNVKGPLVAEKLIVSRSVPIQVSLYGTLGNYRTLARTVGGFLEEKNILLKQGETTQPLDKNTPITAGMLLSINLPGKQVASTNEDIPYTSQTKSNPTLAAGQERVVQEGVVGKRAVLYELELNEAGAEVGRRPLQTITLVEPIQEIREKGTLAAATYSVSSDKAALMAAAGIDPSQFASVDYIITKESNWRPGAINSIGCIGLAQRCPIGGTNALVAACPSWQTDPVCQLRHFSAYANGRYGSWNAAYQVWVVQRWW